MCGIHVIYRFDGQAVLPQHLSAMGRIVQHWGPDDEGMHMDGACGIAMRRLSIVDVGGSHQPFSNSADTLWIVCNRGIYNFCELRLELQAKGYHFKTGSDNEVLLHLYHAEGDHYAHQYQRLPTWIRNAAAFSARQLPADRHSGFLNTLGLTKGFLASADMPCDDRYRSYLQVMDRETVAASLMRFDGEQSDAPARAFAVASHEGTLNRLLAVDAETQLPGDLLMLTDKMSMAVSLKCRVPLLGHHLVEFSAAMPAGVKVCNVRLKHVMKESLGGLLPDEILNRKKRGFDTPMRAWLRKGFALVLQLLRAPDVVERRGLLSAAGPQVTVCSLVRS